MPSPLPPTIRRAAVIGAGTMGAAIAAHLTNAGVPTLLLDVPGTGEAERNAVAEAGLGRAAKARPPAFMGDPVRAAARLDVGNTEDDLARLADADWIVEAIVEQPEAKRALWARVEAVAGPEAIFSSNSSGIPMRVQSEGRSESFRRRFLGAHFYNPPRYLYLLELIPTPDTAPEVLAAVRAFGDRVLGKGIVLANDVPGFIGNRIGIYSLLQTARTAEAMGLPPEAVDALTGPILGRPKSGTMRLADTVGLDVLAFISKDLTAALDGREDFSLPATMQKLLDRGDRGEKSGGGYYRRVKGADGVSTILALDPATMEYEARAASLPEITAIGKMKSAAERTRALLALDGPAGEFSRRTVFEMLRFAAERFPEVANTVGDIDHALEWGFGWELGPFRLMDALGADFVEEGLGRLGLEVPETIKRSKVQGPRPKEGSREKVQAGGGRFYPEGGQAGGAEERFIVLADWKRDAKRTVRAWPGANLVDLGDGALLLEFTSKANALGKDAFAAVEAAITDVVPGGFAGLVIGNQGRWFSAGADLGALLKDAEAGDTPAIEAMIRGFQTMTTGLRAAPFPVVAAPFGMTLGGGCETMLYSDRVQADAELATGLVELKVGLMPSAGGTTEMLARAVAGLAAGEDAFAAAERVFWLIAGGEVSGSALAARELGFLRAEDGISMNKRRLLGDAKDALLALAAAGYRTPGAREIMVTGAAGHARLLALAEGKRAAGEWSAYDVHLAGELARILTGGGPGSAAGRVPEARLLELEREVFIGLCGRAETQARIGGMLRTGKPLRN